jgi:hypothetical protein
MGRKKKKKAKSIKEEKHLKKSGIIMFLRVFYRKEALFTRMNFVFCIS